MSVKNYVARFKNYQFDFNAITNTRNIINSATFSVLCCMQHKTDIDSYVAVPHTDKNTKQVTVSIARELLVFIRDINCDEMSEISRQAA